MRPRKILLVDDEPSILHSTRLLLGELGYEVVTLDRADAIVSTAREQRPDVLLQDVRMPGLDVADLMAQLRADPALARLPVLLFSASMDLDEVADKVGATRRLEKPFKPADLLDAIEGALA